MSKYKVFRNHIIQSLHELSDYNFQRIAWFPNDQGLSSDFADDVCAVFEVSNLEGAIYDKGTVVFSKAADQALRELNALCDAVGYHRLDTELINAPDMQAVRDKAAEALELVKASDGSESTEEIVE